MQAKLLAGVFHPKDPPPPDDELLSLALRNLAHVEFLGVFPRFDAFADALGLPHVRHVKDPTDRLEFSPAEEEVIAAGNAVDQALYEHVSSLLTDGPAERIAP